MRFAVLLGAMLTLALAAQVLMVGEFLRVHPAAQRPWGDGEVYWDMAARMSDGEWMGTTPFLSAPLYPYALGVLRRVGTGLRGVYATQVVLHLVTAVMMALASRRRFGSHAALLAAAIYLLLADTSVATMRVMANGVQLALSAALWWAWTAADRRPHLAWSSLMGIGALAGVLALAAPQMVLLVPVIGLWTAWRVGKQGWTRGAMVVAVAAAVIAPATVHNAIVGREFIPITAHAGVTLVHGNQPRSIGVLTPIAGFPPGRIGMHEAAAHLFEQTTGRAGSWREIDRFFMARALGFWRDQPGVALQLWAMKAYRFAIGWAYDDTEPVHLDRRFGLAEWTRLAPIEVPWILGLALVGVWAWKGVARRRLRELLPEAALIGVSLATVVLFFYSPRYRLSALPPLCGLAAYGVTAWPRMGRARMPALVLAAIVPLLTVLNARTGFELPDRMLPVYTPMLAASYVRVADRQLAEGDVAGAERSLGAALRLLPNSAAIRAGLDVVRGQRQATDPSTGSPR